MRDEDPRLTRLRELGATVGSSIYLGPEVYFEYDFAELLTIEDGVVLSQGCTVLLHDSSLNNLVGAPIRFGEVTFAEGAYVGADSLVMCGVRVGRGALVGAASLVTADVPDGAVAYGSPARVHTTVDELVERTAAVDDPRWFQVPARSWRHRDADEDQQLLTDIAAAFAARRGAPGSDRPETTDQEDRP